MPIYALNKKGELYEVNSVRDDGFGIGRVAYDVDEGSTVFGYQSDAVLKKRSQLEQKHVAYIKEKKAKKIADREKRKKLENEKYQFGLKQRDERLQKNAELHAKRSQTYYEAKKQNMIGYDFNSLIGDPLAGFGSDGRVVHDKSLKGEGAKERISNSSAFGESTLYNGENSQFGDVVQIKLPYNVQGPTPDYFFDPATTSLSQIDESYALYVLFIEYNRFLSSIDDPSFEDQRRAVEYAEAKKNALFARYFRDRAAGQAGKKAFDAKADPIRAEIRAAGQERFQKSGRYSDQDPTPEEKKILSDLDVEGRYFFYQMWEYVGNTRIYELLTKADNFLNWPPQYVQPKKKPANDVNVSDDEKEALILRLLSCYYFNSVMYADSDLRSIYGDNGAKDFQNKIREKFDGVNRGFYIQLGDALGATMKEYVKINGRGKVFLSDSKWGLPAIITPFSGTKEEIGAMMLADAGKPNFPTVEEMAAAFTLAGIGDFTNIVHPPAKPLPMDFFSFIMQLVSAISDLPTFLITHLPVVKDVYAGVNNLTGGGLASLIKVAQFGANMVTGNFAGALNSLEDFALTVKIGGVALSEGPAALALGQASQALKNSALGASPIGQALINSGMGAAITTSSNKAANKAASASSDPEEQTQIRASAQAAANTGAIVGNKVAEESFQSSFQDSLQAQGQAEAKKALVSQLASSDPVEQAIINNAANGIFSSEPSLNGSSIAQSVISTSLDKTKNSILSVGSNLDASLNGVRDAHKINSPDLDKNLSKLGSDVEKDPIGSVGKLIDSISNYAQFLNSLGTLNDSAALTASNIKRFKESHGTVKNIVTGQTYQSVNVSDIEEKINLNDLSSNDFADSSVQANLSNNARRLNVQILPIPNLNFSKQERLGNAEKLKNNFSQKIVTLNIKTVAAHDAYVTAKNLLDALIKKGSEPGLAANYKADIDYEVLKAYNEMNDIKASTLRTIAKTQLAQAQVALKIAAAEEGRYYPGMFDTAHPMLVVGEMVREA